MRSSFTANCPRADTSLSEDPPQIWINILSRCHTCYSRCIISCSHR